ncbi:MAG: carboxypeptidase-like regulatory domain-containing protein, partial [Bacteroidales bacterium]|nr:carboxypeptidase-like regulatory domain-containing protein [Bacteroidales bacterium]
MERKKYFLILLFLTWLFAGNNVLAQTAIEPDIIVLSGVVKDKHTKKTLENVNITVKGTNIGTVTNADGRFSLKIKDMPQNLTAEFSHLGYAVTRLPIRNSSAGLTVFLTDNDNVLKELVIYGNPRQLVEEAISRIETNYSTKKNLLTGFYRETVQKRRNYINVTEAVVSILKMPYNERTIDKDRVLLQKGRKLISPKVGDTLAVKLLGGPTLAILADVVKNVDIVLNHNELDYYKFTMEDGVMIDDQPHYVIRFEPQVLLSYPLYEGRLFIDKQTLTFSRGEYCLDMKDLAKVSNVILKKKPPKLRFKPENVSFLVTYKQRNGTTLLNYIRSEIRFKCDWKRRLFSTIYTVCAEVVVTDEIEQPTMLISHKQSFKPNQALSDNVSDFMDKNFWQDYNIIEPTESLESAVGKLKKQ